MMRGGYPASVQPAFDTFLKRINDLVFEQQAVERKEEFVCQLVLRDPSGLARVIFADGDQGSWVDQSHFERSYGENQELGLVSQVYTIVPDEEKIKTPEGIAKMVKDAKRIVLISGAGMSVESGIPPFRSQEVETPIREEEEEEEEKRKKEKEEEEEEEGELKAIEGNQEGDEGDEEKLVPIWKAFDPNKMTVGRFNSDNEIVKDWWKMKHDMIPKIERAEPNPAHQFFASLEKLGKLKGIITQNIDSLHHRSGVPGSKIIEIHGHMRGLICSNHRTKFNPIPSGDGGCDFRISEEDAKKKTYFQGVDIPKCEKCGSPLRTETVMFEQPLPEGSFSSAQEMVSQCDLLFIVGTSLVVRPVNELPIVAMNQKVPFVIINLHETQMDQHATGLVQGKAGLFFSEVVSSLKEMFE